MKITVLSGGSGNDAILKGLKYYYPECDLKIIINAYDNGKSTGICRFVTDTLGVSDIRKNHTKMYKIMTPELKQNKDIFDFYDNRYNFTKGNEKNEVLEKINSYSFTDDKIKQSVLDFFEIEKSKEVEYKDFSIANIVYSSMYKKLGYEKTNKYFCKLLGIDDCVLLNSFDNIYLKANTQKGYIIHDEGELVEWANKNDKIIDVSFDGEYNGINQKAIDRISESDLIIHSTGTFWSSTYSTLKYGDFYKYLNKSKAKKIWIMNTEEDKDAFGVSSNDFIKYYEKLGLNVDDWNIIQNLDAVDSLKNTIHSFSFNLGNIEGKNDYKEVGKAIFKVYYGLFDKYDKVLLDFDDTLVSRQRKYSEASKENLNLIQDNMNIIIISGNSYNSLRESCSLYDMDISKIKNEIWANVNSDKYIMGKIKESLKENELKDFDTVKKLIPVTFQEKTDYSCKYCIKIKPLTNGERIKLSKLLNKLFSTKKINAIALKTGKTTIDIINPYNKKKTVYYKEKFNIYKTLYIGDEISYGSDRDIALCCNKSLEVNNPRETNIILKLLEM